ncbi:MAG: heavy-metal-associated domain-containing protein [Nitrospirae bacterium]|nr:heavy-metal-associated domain-containing protein [Nitrospirota bacterium]MBI3351271.1 heavy-metal-associated domain-containing protein [Nitrospirota bacterium]
METKILDVKGMTCQHCVKTVTGALGQIKGVKSVDIVLEKGTVTVVYDPAQARTDQFKTAVEEAGYEIS